MKKFFLKIIHEIKYQWWKKRSQKEIKKNKDLQKLIDETSKN